MDRFLTGNVCNHSSRVSSAIKTQVFASHSRRTRVLRSRRGLQVLDEAPGSREDAALSSGRRKTQGSENIFGGFACKHYDEKVCDSGSVSYLTVQLGLKLLLSLAEKRQVICPVVFTEEGGEKRKPGKIKKTEKRKMGHRGVSVK